MEPNSGSMHVPIEGVYSATEKIEDRVANGEKHNQKHVEKPARAYLEPIRNRMQKPIEGLSSRSFSALNKGGDRHTRATEHTQGATRKHTRHSTATQNNRKDPNYEAFLEFGFRFSFHKAIIQKGIQDIDR